ncbi:hypothetical protein HOD20_08935 [archaeon]|nr:hypothetical protein [archaeon]MBT4647238.1 hypothetical protein [archaeon]MBT6821025.1 hypothetical protein [archaeon]MBT7391454.1 hypothetical protein [archaeon]
MVNIKFLEKLFNTKKEAQIPAIELQEWFENQSEDNLKKIDENIDSSFNEVENIKQNIITHLKELEKSELMNPDVIQSREKHMMQGNREAYIRKMNNFLDSLTIPELTYDSALEFSQSLEEKLDTLSQNTQRSFYILKNFFDDVLSKITKELKELENTGKYIIKIVTEDEVKKILDTIDSIKDFNERLHNKEKIETKLDEMNVELVEKENKKEETKEKIEKLKSSESFIEYNNLIIKESNANKKINKIKTDILQVISPFEKSLRKFQRESVKEEIIKAYLNNPSKALLQDKDIDILNILKNLKIWLNKEDIKSKEKIIKKIDSLNYKIFLDLAENLVRSEKEAESIKNSVKANPSDMNFKELAYQIEHFDSKIKTLKSEIKKSETELNSLKIKSKKEKLESEIFEFSGTELTII